MVEVAGNRGISPYACTVFEFEPKGGLVLHTQLEILYSSYLQLNEKYLCFIFIRNICLISIKRVVCQLSPQSSGRKNCPVFAEMKLLLIHQNRAKCKCRSATCRSLAVNCHTPFRFVKTIQKFQLTVAEIQNCTKL